MDSSAFEADHRHTVPQEEKATTALVTKYTDFTSDKIPRYYYLLATHKSIQLTAHPQVEECPVSHCGADRTNSGNQFLDLAPLGKRWSCDSGAKLR